MNYLLALVICIVAAVIESICAGRDPLTQLRAVRQPRWSAPVWVWVLIGIAWYLICFIALARLMAQWPASMVAVLLLAALMLANAAANIFQFRMRRLDLAFFFLFPYWVLLAVFMLAACPLDRVACWLFGGYAVYQLYAAGWGYALWRMNRATS